MKKARAAQVQDIQPDANVVPDASLAYARPAQEILTLLDVDEAFGLSDQDARARLFQYGLNRIETRPKASAFRIFLHQLLSPVVALLLAAAALSFYFGGGTEPIAIIAVLAINTAIGFSTEIRAARSIEALRALGGRTARVRRDGAVHVIPAEHVVPGDILLVEAGDAISADLRLIRSFSLAADESTLTGESVAVDKSPAPVAPETRIAGRASMLFAGTHVTRGNGVAVAVGTGHGTELGRIAELARTAKPESTPLERKLARLAGQLVWAAIVIAALIALSGSLNGKQPIAMIKTAIALAVAAIPEGLPIVATLALARGMWRMAKKNALIERLSAVETLGAATVILTDKTGTLTENRMAVQTLMAAPEGSERELLETAALCNTAEIAPEGKESGDPMEVAILRVAQTAGVMRQDLLAAFPEVHRHPFDTASRMMATVHADGESFLFAVKGAPEAIIAGAVNLSGEARKRWLQMVSTQAEQGLRVLACAKKTETDAAAGPFSGLWFLGLIALEDPVRPDVPAALSACREAGIRVVMVTGDHAATALGIARRIGLSGPDATVIEGGGLEGLKPGDPRLANAIFARVEPAEKLLLVEALQKSGEIVAMTGDGVNDAPALRKADIGIAMGLRGTDVARESAAMILLDDAFPSIVAAIREGRIIFANIRRFSTYLLSCNLSEIIIVGLAVLLSLPLPLLPLQILYLNLVTDVFPAFALALGEGAGDAMRRPPRNPGEAILRDKEWRIIVLQGLVLSAATLGALILAREVLALDQRGAVTTAFLTLAFAQLWHVFNMRSARTDLWHDEVASNPWIWAALALSTAMLILPLHIPALTRLFALTPPGPAAWAAILGMSFAPLAIFRLVAFCRKGRLRERRT